MSAKGVDDIKAIICRLIKTAAQCQEIEGDEPLIILWTLMAKMVSEIEDDVSRKAFTGAVANSFDTMVDMYRNRTVEDAEEFFKITDELLH